MQNRDILYLLTSRLDNSVLKSLSTTTLWGTIKKFSNDQHWWYLRIQYLFKHELKQRLNAGWKRAYRVLVRAIEAKINNLFTLEVLGNLLAVQVLLELGYDPSVENNNAIGEASRFGYADVVKLILTDPRVDPTIGLNYAINIAIVEGRTNVVEVLLSDSRIDPSLPPSSPPIVYAIHHRQLVIAKMLLADRRVKLPNSCQYSVTCTSGELRSIIAGAWNTNLQSIDERTIRSILQDVPRYSADALEGCIELSEGRMEANKLLVLLAAGNFTYNHYYIFLRELILKRLQLTYYFEWLVEQCKRHEDATRFRELMAEAAESFKNTGQVVHTSPLFTAYSGFLLLAKTDNPQAILNLLSREGASQEGLQLAGMLIGAYLGKSSQNRR